MSSNARSTAARASIAIRNAESAPSYSTHSLAASACDAAARCARTTRAAENWMARYAWHAQQADSAAEQERAEAAGLAYLRDCEIAERAEDAQARAEAERRMVAYHAQP